MSVFQAAWRRVATWACVGLMVSVSGLAPAAPATPSAQLRRGEEIAQARCSACHVVADKQEFQPLLEQPGPTFVSIANRAQVSEETLRHFITTTHWDQKTVPVTMPNPELSKADTVAVIRYILSLKGR